MTLNRHGKDTTYNANDPRTNGSAQVVEFPHRLDAMKIRWRQAHFDAFGCSRRLENDPLRDGGAVEHSAKVRRSESDGVIAMTVREEVRVGLS